MPSWNRCPFGRGSKALGWDLGREPWLREIFRLATIHAVIAVHRESTVAQAVGGARSFGPMMGELMTW
jgi:hypothetical protein